MKDLIRNIQKLVEKMHQEDKKRKDIVISHLNQITQTIASACQEMYGDTGGHNHLPSPAVWVWTKKEDGKKLELPLYFRYAPHTGRVNGINTVEDVGFYVSHRAPYFGTPVATLQGKDFWWATKTIVDWLPLLASEISHVQETRHFMQLQLAIEKSKIDVIMKAWTN